MTAPHDERCLREQRSAFVQEHNFEDQLPLEIPCQSSAVGFPWSHTPSHAVQIKRLILYELGLAICTGLALSITSSINNDWLRFGGYGTTEQQS